MKLESLDLVYCLSSVPSIDCSHVISVGTIITGRLVFVVVVYFILSRLLYLVFSANLGLLCMPHPGMGPLV